MEKTEGCGGGGGGVGGVAMDRRRVYVLMVLWVMAHLSFPGYGLRALRRTTGGRKGSTGLTGQDANGVPLRRSKRGWMWNQFFLLEEYTGTDMQYVGKVNEELFVVVPSSDATSAAQTLVDDSRSSWY